MIFRDSVAKFEADSSNPSVQQDVKKAWDVPSCRVDDFRGVAVVNV